jgi:hypothetical protein
VSPSPDFSQAAVMRDRAKANSPLRWMFPVGVLLLRFDGGDLFHNFIFAQPLLCATPALAGGARGERTLRKTFKYTQPRLPAKRPLGCENVWVGNQVPGPA